MPPIDPARLRSRTEALAAQFNDAPAAARAVRRLLDEYADRTHRASPRLASSAAGLVYKTAPPVVRAIAAALRTPALADPLAALRLAEALWAGGSREERRLAAEVMGFVAPGAVTDVLELVERWAPAIESGETADALAELGLGALFRTNPNRFLDLARAWAASPSRWVRRLALACVLPLLKDRQWDNVPSALAVVRPAMHDSDAEVRRAAAAALEALGPRSPAEVARFMREHAARATPAAHWIIRNALDGLADEDRTEIVRLLRS
jgi:3-methyladenine DNA glycosylase AlkD